jgi:hypothetical protein
MPPDTPDHDENLPELLDDLEATLSALRSELQADSGADDRSGADRRRRRDRRQSDTALPRPPSVSDLLGFTEQYTLPTLISTLEATIRALELLRGSLRLVNPDRSALEPPAGRRERSPASRVGTGAAGVGREAVSGVERALSELEAALAESDVPRDRASDELLGEVRDLSAEVRARLEAARGAGDTDRGRRQEADREDRQGSTEPNPDGVAIEVTDGSDGDDSDATADDPEDESRPEVDVEAELASIRREVHSAGDADAPDGVTDDGAHRGESDGDPAADENGGADADGSGRGSDGAAEHGGDGRDGAGSGSNPRA